MENTQGDPGGRLPEGPGREGTLRALVRQFAFGRFYTAQEACAVLERRRVFGDPLPLCRELASRGLLCGVPGDSRLWRGDFFAGDVPGAVLRRVGPEDAEAVERVDSACADYYTAYAGRPSRRGDAAAVAEGSDVPPGGDPAFFHAWLLASADPKDMRGQNAGIKANGTAGRCVHPVCGHRPLLCGAGEEPAGYLAYYLGYPRGDEAFIAALFLCPSSRRQGLGTAVTEAFASQAKAAGLRALHIAVMTENAPGIAFWKSRGFAPAGRVSPFEDTGKFAERYSRPL